MLILIGVYGLLFELRNPGLIVPAVVGAIGLLMALYAFQVLPMNYAGLALILLGVGLMVRRGLRAHLRYARRGRAHRVRDRLDHADRRQGDAARRRLRRMIAASAAASAAFFFGVVYLALRARRRAVVSGAEELIGSRGEALEDFTQGTGRVRVHSEEWQARAVSPIQRGAHVKVTGRDGLVLVVEPNQRSA